MFNCIHYINIFGYSTTKPFTILFPRQFFIYNCTNLLVIQRSFNRLQFTFISKESVLTCLFVINIYFVLEIFNESLFAVSQSVAFVI